MDQALKIKVCGMRETHNIEALAKEGIDYMGFIFYDKSKRSVVDVDLEVDFEKPKRVGVFVNEAVDFIQKKVKEYKLSAIQLHGDESSRFCKALTQDEIEVIKVFSVGEDFDFSITQPYEEYCDYFLFDTKGKERGGNGERFNWNLLEGYQGSLPFFLSGGIGPQHVDSIQNFKHEKLIGLDLNSQFEISPGLKNIELLKTFIDGIRS